jgi:NAD(P)-dependent dehydrogenase (short-subunit alcohol dehydrogenase family)
MQSSLLQAGCSKVYITSRKASACTEAVAALNALPNKPANSTAIAIPADLSKIDEIDRLAAEVGRTTGHVDILLANAGATWGERFETHPPQAFGKVLDLNVKSVFYTVQKFEPLLRAAAAAVPHGQPNFDDPSRVIVTASVAGIGIGTLGEQATFSYSASKAAVIHLVKNLAVELGPRGIVCNAIAPGFYPSKMANGLMELQGGVDKIAAETPNQRVGHPEDFAGLVVFLATRAATHLNGAVITTDGGAVLSRGRL